MNALLEQFISEARDLLEQANTGLLALEQAPEDRDTLNTVFRAFHTIKGSSGLFDVAPLTRLLHAAEDLLGELRERGAAVDGPMMDALLAAVDQVAAWVDALETKASLPDGAETDAAGLLRRLRGLLGGNDERVDAAAPPRAGSGGCEPPAWLAALPEPVRREAAERARRGEAVTALEYRPDEQCFFSGDDPLHQMRQAEPLIGLQIEPAEPWPAPEAWDPFRCMLVFRALVAADATGLEEAFRYVPDQVALTPCRAEWFDEAPPAPRLEGRARLIFSELLREQISVLDAGDNARDLPALARTLEGALRFAGLERDAARVRASAGEPDATETLRRLIPEVLERCGFAVRRDTPAMDAEAVTPASPNAEEVRRAAPRTLKIDQAKIDQLMDVTGELIVAKNVLPFLARRAEKGEEVQRLARAIKEQYQVFNRIAEELQQAIMQVRMLPVSSVFQRFPRLVRDLSRKLDKQVRLVTAGEETEADKNVIEQLSDPLIHLVRNSLDHGVEPPEERLATGKPAEGIIRLEARYAEDNVVITIADDGRGIDPQALKAKALAMGAIDAAKAEAMTEQEALHLIFHPGLSMAKQVSDVSGRGVGMDAVRAMVGACGGSVQVHSKRGEGTRIELSLPMSMAVSRVMIIEQHGQSFGVPIDQIIETMRVPRGRLLGIKHQRTVDWRGRCLPLVGLAERLELEPHSERETLAVLVVQIRNEPVGLLVDDFVEGEDILVKPLQGVLATLPVFSGSALLGDGTVLLVLNLKEIL